MTNYQLLKYVIEEIIVINLEMKKEFLDQLLSEHLICETCPSPKEVADFFIDLLGTLYLDFAKVSLKSKEALLERFEELKGELNNLLCRNPMNAILGTENIVDSFFKEVPKIYELLNKDIMAIYEGDPACNSRREVIRSYPGFYAIAAYRVANVCQLHDGCTVVVVSAEFYSAKKHSYP